MNVGFNFIKRVQMPQNFSRQQFFCRCGTNIPKIDQLKENIWHQNNEFGCAYLRYWQNKTTDCWKGECGLYKQVQLEGLEDESTKWQVLKVLSYINTTRLIDCIDDYLKQVSLLDIHSLENVENQKAEIWADKWIDQKLSHRFIGIHLGSLVKENIKPFYISQLNPSLPLSPLLRNYPGRKLTFVVYNHSLATAQSKTAWASLEKAWDSMRPGDYLVVKDLTADCFEARGIRKYSVKDGIVEFYREGEFYRSALSENFSSFLQNRLLNVRLIFLSISHIYPNIAEKAFGISYTVFQKNPLLKVEENWEEAIGSFEEFKKTDLGILGFLATEEAAEIVAKKRGINPKTLFNSNGICYDYEVGYEALKLQIIAEN